MRFGVIRFNLNNKKIKVFLKTPLYLTDRSIFTISVSTCLEIDVYNYVRSVVFTRTNFIYKIPQ